MYGGVFQVVGFLTAVSAAAGGIAYFLFKLLASKWLESKFEEGLKNLEHRHNQELENIRYEIGKLLDRATKLSQREFEVLPECWRLLIDFRQQVTMLTATLQSYADLNRMDAERLEEFLKTTFLAGWQKRELRESDNRNAYWQLAVHFERARKCRDAGRLFIETFEPNCIFIVPSLADKMKQLSQIILSALAEHELNIEEKIVPRIRDSQKQFDVEGKRLFDELTKMIRERLWGDQLPTQ